MNTIPYDVNSPDIRKNFLAHANRVFRKKLRRYLTLPPGQAAAMFVHPDFGPLDADEWERAHFRHCSHRLLQLGSIETRPADANPLTNVRNQ